MVSLGRSSGAGALVTMVQYGRLRNALLAQSCLGLHVDLQGVGLEIYPTCPYSPNGSRLNLGPMLGSRKTQMQRGTKETKGHQAKYLLYVYVLLRVPFWIG